jgi:hypothetical protein
MQAVLDSYMESYNQCRPHQGRGMNGRTPPQAFVDGLSNLIELHSNRRKNRKNAPAKDPLSNTPLNPPQWSSTVSRLLSLHISLLLQPISKFQ